MIKLVKISEVHYAWLSYSKISWTARPAPLLFRKIGEILRHTGTKSFQTFLFSEQLNFVENLNLQLYFNPSKYWYKNFVTYKRLSFSFYSQSISEIYEIYKVTFNLFFVLRSSKNWRLWTTLLSFQNNLAPYAEGKSY